MGPRPFGRGRWRRRRQRRRRLCSFNGAATFRPRKGGNILKGVKTFLVLQWGRDLSAAEGLLLLDLRHETFPLQWGRDLSAAEGSKSKRKA